MQLAMRHHEYLSPAISSAAVARAKDEFETLRQKSEDTLTEHVNEFKRRLQVYLKARGADQPSPYADFDLRDLLLRSLYQPTWGTWIEYRYANDNMPATYAELVDALNKTETTKILRASSPMDPFQSSAHATVSRETPPHHHQDRYGVPCAGPPSYQRGLSTHGAIAVRRSTLNNVRRNARRPKIRKGRGSPSRNLTRTGECTSPTWRTNRMSTILMRTRKRTERGPASPASAVPGPPARPTASYTLITAPI